MFGGHELLEQVVHDFDVLVGRGVLQRDVAGVVLDGRRRAPLHQRGHLVRVARQTRVMQRTPAVLQSQN